MNTATDQHVIFCTDCEKPLSIDHGDGHVRCRACQTSARTNYLEDKAR